MNTNSTGNLSDRELDKRLSTHPGTLTPTIQKILEGHMSFVNRYSSFSHTDVAFFYLKANRVIFNTGYNAVNLKHPAVCVDIVDNRNQIDRLTHIDDLQFWADLQLDTYDMLMEMTPGERTRFSVVGSRRLLEKTGRYQSYLHEIMPYNYDEANCPILLTVLTRRINSDDFPQFRYFRHPTAGYTEMHPFSANIVKLSLTPRIQEALDKYSRNKTVEVVAAEMGITVATVKEYFKKVKDTMGVPSIKIAGEIWRILSNENKFEL